MVSFDKKCGKNRRSFQPKKYLIKTIFYLIFEEEMRKLLYEKSKLKKGNFQREDDGYFMYF